MIGLGLSIFELAVRSGQGFARGSSLALDFLNGNNTLDPRITFSRTTNATLTNSAGLIANAPMNLLTFSEQFDNAAWSVARCTITANTAIAPDGSTTADTLVEDTTSNSHPVFRTITGFTTTAYTGSCYIKANVRTQARIAFASTAFAASPYVDFNLSAVTANGANGATGTITSVGNGWYRCTATATAGAAGNGDMYIQPLLAGAPSYLGTGANALYLWGAQLELGSTATTYNPTTVKNLLGFTEHFDNAAWTKSNAFVQTNLLAFSAFNAIGTSSTTNAWYETSAALDTTVNSAIAPDGTQTAALLAINSATSFAAVFQVPTTATANTYAYSVYCKAVSTDTTCRLLLSGDASLANFVRANFTLSGAGSASVADVSGTAVSAATPTIQAVGDGWYRCTIAGTLTAPTSTRVLVYPGNPGAQTTASQTLVWGAQLVQGTTPGDYKATYAAAAAVGYTDIYGQPFAQKLVEDTATGTHRVLNNVGVTISTAGLSTYVVYAKAGERTAVRLGTNDTGSGQAVFDLLTGTFTESGTVTASSQFIGDGWWRLAISRISSNGIGRIEVALVNSAGNVSYTGDGTSGIYIFGAQLSDSASVDPYVYQPVAAPTSTAYYGPRFDYDPVTLQPKGLLIEEQRTNLLTYSQEFDNAVWTKGGASVAANSLVAPDGALTADRLVEDTTTGDHRTFQNVSLTSGTSYTFTVYAKPAGRTLIKITSATAALMEATFDIANGTVTNTASGTAAITAVGNGWCRLSLSVAATATTTTNLQIRLVDTGTNTSYTGNGFSGVFLWGAQLEAGSQATSYIPTVASQVTRAADSASMIGNNFARWYTQGAGSMFADVQSAGSVISRAFTVSDSTITNQIFEADSTLMNVYTGGAFQVQMGGTGIVGKVAMAYATNDFAVAKNGGSVTTDTSGALASPYTQLNIGVNYNNTAGHLNGTIKRFAYYPRRLANTELQGITS